MKIRDGFVTNSSSTNFIIISKSKLTEEYLYKKLGFENNSLLKEIGLTLCEEILDGTGLRWFDFDEINYENIQEAFGTHTAEKYKKLIKKNYNVHLGYTSSDESALTSFFTIDSFEIDEKDFYLNGKNCTW